MAAVVIDFEKEKAKRATIVVPAVAPVVEKPARKKRAKKGAAAVKVEEVKAVPFVFDPSAYEKGCSRIAVSVSLMRALYPELAHWTDTALSYAWLSYLVEYHGLKQWADVTAHEPEFLGYLFLRQTTTFQFYCDHNCQIGLIRSAGMVKRWERWTGR